MRRSGLLLLFALLGVAGGGIVGTARGQLAAQVGALEFEREAAESAAEYTKDTMNGYEDGKAAIRGAARAASNYMAAATCS